MDIVLIQYIVGRHKSYSQNDTQIGLIFRTSWSFSSGFDEVFTRQFMNGLTFLISITQTGYTCSYLRCPLRWVLETSNIVYLHCHFSANVHIICMKMHGTMISISVSCFMCLGCFTTVQILFNIVAELNRHAIGMFSNRFWTCVLLEKITWNHLST